MSKDYNLNDLISANCLFALQSVSGEGFLDGRNPEHSEPLLTHRNPVNDKYLLWKIIRLGEVYAIRSLSGGRCLDGRNPEHSQLLLTDRFPNNDKYLQWEIRQLEGNESDNCYAIRSISSGRYIDGRNRNHSNPALTNREPNGDRYLQWKIIPVHWEFGVFGGRCAFQTRKTGHFLVENDRRFSRPGLSAQSPNENYGCQWEIIPSNGYYLMRSASNGKYLTVHEGNLSSMDYDDVTQKSLLYWNISKVLKCTLLLHVESNVTINQWIETEQITLSKPSEASAQWQVVRL